MQTLKKYTKEAFMAITSLGTVFFYTIIFLFLFFIKEFTIAKHIAIGLILCYLFVFVLRIFYFKERPEKEEYYNLFTRINASSFPSLHAMSSIYVAIVLANHIKKSIISIFLVSISLLIAYSRIYLKKHYFVDIMLGLILGIIASIIYLLIINFS
ncbi:phosphatase PAP2 family protein [Candidatus Woesearchaeota archaeon]|nr:phosphatase PAP2 family protein [Candidatus Woesearchaeota archaeon]